MNKKKKLNKIKNNLIPRLCGVEFWEIESGKLYLYLITKLSISIEFRLDHYHVGISRTETRLGNFGTLNSNAYVIILSGKICKNSTELTQFIKETLRTDKDYVFELRKEKLKRLCQ